MPDGIAFHEAAHCTVARLLRVPVVEAYPHVRTRYRHGGRTEAVRVLTKLATIDLAGHAVDSAEEARKTDLINAMNRARQVVRLR